MATDRLPMILFTPYVPQLTGERLAEAGVNFVDEVGNIYLQLGAEYQVLNLGRRRPPAAYAPRRLGPSVLQLYFVLLADAEAVEWPIRRLARAAGIGKTAAAGVLQRLKATGIVVPARPGYRLADRKQLQERFLAGYGEVLRPHLTIGRFRAPGKLPEALLGRFAGTLEGGAIPWAVTGAAGAYELERFYRGETTTIYLQDFTPETQRKLRLLPDANGPLTLLHLFSKKVVWREGAIPVANPLLIYAELLHADDPRELEAAELIGEKYLQV